MTVPNEVAPIDFYNNLFIFTLDNFTLFIDYQKEEFELLTPENLAYFEAFSILDSSPKWLEDIEFGVVDWIKKAIDWNNQVQKKGELIKTTISADGVVYILEYNPSNFDFSLEIPGRTIVSHPNSLYYSFPEFKFMDHGELISLLTAEICYQTQGLEIKHSDRQKLRAPITFHPKIINTSQYAYEFEYLLDYDLIFLSIPTRKIYSNLALVETNLLELVALHNGKLLEAIRNLAINSSLELEHC